MACGQDLVLMANAFALTIAEGASDEELAVLSSFFTIIGDQLALFSACAAQWEEKTEDRLKDSPDKEGLSLT